MSLVSREVIADSIELVARANQFDALVILVGCDKTIPGAAMALARLDVPGLVLYGGSIAPGPLAGQGRHHPGRLRSRRRVRLREARRGGVCGARERRVSGRRRVRRAVHGEHDGHGVRVPRALAVRQRRGAGDGRRQRRRVATGGRARRRPAGRGPPAAADSDAGRVRERHRRGRRHRRLDQRRPASHGDCQGGRRAAESRRHRSRQRLGAAPGRPQARRPVRRHGLLRRRRHAVIAQRLVEAGRLHRRADHRHRPNHRRGSGAGRRSARAGGRAAARFAAAGRGRPRHPPRQPRAGRLRRQGHQDDAAASPRAGAGLRQRGRNRRSADGGEDPCRRRCRHPI